MWNSRNRILIDTDGDDVAFLSGSGRNRTKKYIFYDLSKKMVSSKIQSKLSFLRFR